jgi:hypothetical protein
MSGRFFVPYERHHSVERPRLGDERLGGAPKHTGRNFRLRRTRSRACPGRRIESFPSPVWPERAFQRDSNELTACSNPGFLKQLLQCCLDGAIRNTELGANFLIGKALEYASEYLLLAFRQEGVNSLILPLVKPIGHELNRFWDRPKFLHPQ